MSLAIANLQRYKKAAEHREQDVYREIHIRHVSYPNCCADESRNHFKMLIFAVLSTSLTGKRGFVVGTIKIDHWCTIFQSVSDSFRNCCYELDIGKWIQKPCGLRVNTQMTRIRDNI